MEESEPNTESEPEATPAPFTKEELKLAMKAFRKRLRLARLDDESKLGHGAMTSGGKSGICAVRPPNQFPDDIWKELATAGKLKYDGHGLYQLVE